MATFKYTAKRGLTSGHVVDTVYTIECEIQQELPVEKIKASFVTTELKSVTILNSANTHHKITTDLFTLTEKNAFREFLLSASDGQTIDFDLLGTIASPDNVQTGVLVPQGDFEPTRYGNLYYSYSFEIREQ